MLDQHDCHRIGAREVLGVAAFAEALVARIGGDRRLAGFVHQVRRHHAVRAGDHVGEEWRCDRIGGAVRQQRQ